jgi:phospho-N-acetylmuramoyl-pentapeptide-transferase
LSAVLSWVLTFFLVFVLQYFNCSQVVRPEGPESHKAKSGTPTMGGIGIIITIVLLLLIFFDFDINPQYLALVFVIFGFALIGFCDDFLKVWRKQNLGLTFWQKIIPQLTVAVLFSVFLISKGWPAGMGGILKDLGFGFPLFYGFLSVFLVVGSANATNLTDGLNGLLAGCAGIAFLAFAVLANRIGNSEAAVFSVICAGAVFSFLYFNFPKAKVFMGDVSSLALGAGLAGIALLLHKELRLALIGGIFLTEALSVILQVSYYKMCKKRIFKMAPLHHHFEILHGSELKVVLGFWVVAAFLGVIGACF